MKVKTFNDLFVEQLKDVYSAEKQLLQALPKMAKAASSMEVQRAFEKHLEMTERQKGRLDQIFERIGATPGRMKCKGMEGLIAEGEELIKSGEKSQVMDAGLIASAQKVEHYEMATYGTLRTFANMLGEKEVANLLQQTLNEEGETDHMLTRLAEQNINLRAEQESQGKMGTQRTGSTSGGNTGTREMKAGKKSGSRTKR